MALVITGAINFLKGIFKVLRGSLDVASGAGGVLESSADLGSKGVAQIQKVLGGGSIVRKKDFTLPAIAVMCGIASVVWVVVRKRRKVNKIEKDLVST